MSSRIREMSCTEIVELVTEYLEGTMSAHDVFRFEAHLESCEGCVNYLDQIRTTIALTGGLTVDSLPPHSRAALVDAFRDWKSGRDL